LVMATLEGTKWKVTGQKDNNAIVIKITDNKQSVLIYKSEGSVVTIEGKCTSVSVDACKNLGLIFGQVIASVEVVNSSKIQLQVNGSVPTISIDKVNGCTVYAQTPESQKVQILSSLSTELNVVTPGPKPDSDPVESAIPTQYITTFEKGKLVTRCSEHIGV